MKPINDLIEACQLIDLFIGKPEEFRLPLSDQLQDSIGMNMAIITDRILAKGWEPNGFDQGEGFRIYHYKALD